MDKNKKLLNEELKKFKLMCEYNFYNDCDDKDKKVEPGEELILGDNITEEDEDESIDNDIANDLTSDNEKDSDNQGEEEEFGDETEDNEDFGDETEDEEDFGDLGDLGGEEDLGGGEEDSVELDVTELVKGTEEAKASADAANDSVNAVNGKMSDLMNMVNNLEKQLDGMSAISSKIDSLETELEKRAPTPEEKIEMRSLDSYPYNLKLTDFWKDKEGQYDIIDKEVDNEYVLTKDDVDDYSEEEIKDTFNQNPYEEEEI